jgi:hypothetical protein
LVSLVLLSPGNQLDSVGLMNLGYLINIKEKFH